VAFGRRSIRKVAGLALAEALDHLSHRSIMRIFGRQNLRTKLGEPYAVALAAASRIGRGEGHEEPRFGALRCGFL